MRILAYLNVSFAGIFAFSRTVMVGESSDLRLLDLNECVRVARENRDLIVGIKVRVGRGAGGSSGVAPLDMGQGAFEFHDTQGERLAADRRFQLKGMVVGGQWWPPAGGKMVAAGGRNGVAGRWTFSRVSCG